MNQVVMSMALYQLSYSAPLCKLPLRNLCLSWKVSLKILSSGILPKDSKIQLVFVLGFHGTFNNIWLLRSLSLIIVVNIKSGDNSLMRKFIFFPKPTSQGGNYTA